MNCYAGLNSILSDLQFDIETADSPVRASDLVGVLCSRATDPREER